MVMEASAQQVQKRFEVDIKELPEQIDTSTFKSPAEFFEENKKMAGFDNPGKSLYSTVRGVVENALDSAESIGELPIVEVTIEEIDRSELDSMIEKPLDKNSAKEEPTADEASIYTVTCKDNGRGMVHDDIPNMFGRVLFGTKHEVKQTRGKSGLGAKMAIIWSKMSTGKPVEISTSMQNQSYTTLCRLDIDTQKNIPRIHLHEKIYGMKKWHGAVIQVVIEGNWKTYGCDILEYMRQMALITPYAEFMFRFVSHTRPDDNVEIKVERRTNVMPAFPLETKEHPLGMDLNLLAERINDESSNQKNLLQFLQNEIVNIDAALAKRLIGEIMGPDVTSETQVNSLNIKQILCMQQLFRQAAKFCDPSGKECRLIPLGEENLCVGIVGQLQAETVATHTASGQVCGHPFIVEAGVCMGSEYLQQGLNVFRFANRVPLLFVDEVDVVTIAMNEVNWESYKINQYNDKVGLFVSIVSTKIPFKEPEMEYIGDDISEISDAVKTCLEECCIRLERVITSNVNDAAKIVYPLLMSMAHPDNELTEEYVRESLYLM